MNTNPELIMAALFDLLRTNANTAGLFKSFSRKLKLWSDVDKADKPALFLSDYQDNDSQVSSGITTKTIMDADVTVYARGDVSDPSIVGSTILNNMVWAVRQALLPIGQDAFQQRQTLGGLVQHCWVEGTVMKDPGDLDGDIVGIVPIKLLVP